MTTTTKHTFLPAWRKPMAALAAAAALAFGPALGQAQQATPSAKGQGAPLTLLLSGPKGEHSTLAYSADSGWRMQPGWITAKAAEGGGKSPLTPVAFPAAAPDLAAQTPALARPLTVFLDGPTGFTFVYVPDEGWKYVGQIANPGR